MCGRFTLHTPPEYLRKHFDVEEVPEVAESYNVAPSRPVAAVRTAGRRREMVLMRWGLLPAWAKEAKTAYSMINARAETVADKPAYCAAFRHRRCLIPADGFYEWKPSARGKQPYYIRMQDERVFAFAGLWERWERGGDVIESCAIIVTGANDTIRPVHERMPVIIEPPDYMAWLDPEMQGPDDIRQYLRPYPAAAMIAYPVGQRVNSPVNNDAQCIAPVDI